MFGEGIDEHGRCGDPSDLVHRRMLVKMVTNTKKVKGVSIPGKHRCRSDANVVERLAIRGHPDGGGEVLRETRLSHELESQWNDWGHIAPRRSPNMISVKTSLAKNVLSNPKLIAAASAARVDFTTL